LLDRIPNRGSIGIVSDSGGYVLPATTWKWAVGGQPKPTISDVLKSIYPIESDSWAYPAWNYHEIDSAARKLIPGTATTTNTATKKSLSNERASIISAENIVSLWSSSALDFSARMIDRSFCSIQC
jgi:hypothetical protein